jgi:signal peptidase I
MTPALLRGDEVFASKLAYAFADPARGDVAVFLHPPSLAEGRRDAYVQRVVGLPGETVEVRAGQVFLDGVAVPREDAGERTWQEDFPKWGGCLDVRSRAYVEHLGERTVTVLVGSSDGERAPDVPPTRVPEGSYFLLGDHRDGSADSRVWGFVPRDHFLGRVTVVWQSENPCDVGSDHVDTSRAARVGLKVP